MATIICLAPELLELVLSYLAPSDLISFARTCHHASEFIRPNNQILWKASFLQVFDHPKHAWNALVPTARAANKTREAEWDWHHELQRRLIAFNAVCKSDHSGLLFNVADVVKALLDVEETASCMEWDEGGNSQSLNVKFLQRLGEEKPDKLDSIVHDFHRGFDSASLPLETMAAAHFDRRVTRSIKTLAYNTYIIHGPTRREEDSMKSKAAARAIVYDWTVTGPEAECGPFKKDLSGAVDWQTVEAISSLMHRLFAVALKMYELSTSGFAMNIPHAVAANPTSPEDWAGVTGIWLGTYAFLDYRALVHYNFTNNQEYSLDLGGSEEACGDLMRLELKMEDTEELQQDHRLQTVLPHCEDLPVLFFRGSSHNETSGRTSIGVRGSASLVPDGRSVRWRFIIRYAGSDQWQLEGVQPSGVRSGPIYGLWSHADHDEHGPMGPFYYAPAELCDITHGQASNMRTSPSISPEPSS
ncbi:hypothetical protein CC80DRAFT_420626 [Byssothecium circinans]|uniref:F-box domain-containing protein n=1 Tax=Byssothecium circinans TaxID=147558 RepID=A0A6A5TQT3_9PLEO|nr:hypothetical protein CC80DRAFT_420626 [Byssothecium circinans]